MNDEQTLLRHIKHEKEIQLSSLFTKPSLILVFLISFFSLKNTWNKIFNHVVTVEYIFSFILFLALFGACLLAFKFSVDATIEGKRIRIKPILRKAQIVNINDITILKSFESAKINFTLISYLNNEAEEKKALIINSGSIIYGYENSAARVISLAQDHFKI